MPIIQQGKHRLPDAESATIRAEGIELPEHRTNLVQAPNAEQQVIEVEKQIKEQMVPDNGFEVSSNSRCDLWQNAKHLTRKGQWFGFGGARSYWRWASHHQRAAFPGGEFVECCHG